MRIRLSLPYILAFAVLTLFFHELHELAHMATARIVCGCWGTRDFLYWKLCTGCETKTGFIIITLAGPLFTYLLMWIGWYCMRSASNTQRISWGITLVFANLPFARLLAAAFRGGDEIMAMRNVFDEPSTFKGIAVITGIIAVLALTIPPLWTAFKKMNIPFRKVYFMGFLILPYYFDKLVLEYGLNSIQPTGILSEPAFWGASWLVAGYQITLVVLFLLCRKFIARLFVMEKNNLI